MSTDFTSVELSTVAKTSISIRPFYKETVENMGLEKYEMVVYDNVEHTEQLACLEINGTTRYVTGLDEFAPEIKRLPEAEREAKIKEIRKIVSSLEKDLASNVIDPEDKDFWNKVTLLKPNNKEFWNRIEISAGNSPVYLNPIENPYDLIKLCAIKAGGFSMIAKSYEDAKKLAKAPKFYLDKVEETAAIKNEIKKTRNKALAELQKMYDSGSKKLFFVAKVVDGNSAQYRESTPKELIYDSMDTFIHGEGIERSKTRAAQSFIDAAKLSMEDLTIKSIIKDATFNKFIVLKSDGFIYETESNIMLGQSTQDVFEFFKNPLNDETFKRVKTQVESFWKN